jgi:hypothetical protein
MSSSITPLTTTFLVLDDTCEPRTEESGTDSQRVKYVTEEELCYHRRHVCCHDLRCNRRDEVVRVPECARNIVAHIEADGDDTRAVGQNQSQNTNFVHPRAGATPEIETTQHELKGVHGDLVGRS